MPFSIKDLRRKRAKDSAPAQKQSPVETRGTKSETSLTRSWKAFSFNRTLPAISADDPDTQASLHDGKDKRKEPIGLQVLHEPEGQPNIDLIFVHGLNGSCQSSWTWKRNPECFWPQRWLPQEPKLQQARILTFGYNAFYGGENEDQFNISSFSKQLLLQMKFGTHDSESLLIGKALIQGIPDPEYGNILRSVCGIIFLATPHRGSDLAESLNNLLLVSFRSPKKYVSELQRNSTSIEDINEQFRHYASGLQIISFFEQLPLQVGPKNLIIVKRDSAVLGYPNEICAPLNANHAHVSKYPSNSDPNYVAVRGVIQSMVERFGKTEHRLSIDSQTSLRNTLESLFGISEPHLELEVCLESYVEGTCDWILEEPSFLQWINPRDDQLSILHITGHAGTGKSMMAAFVARHLTSIDRFAQYFFFRFDSQKTNKSIRHCLFSLAYQLALVYHDYGRLLKAILEKGKLSGNMDSRQLWQKLFLDIFAKLDTMKEVYWVIDALDESESLQFFLQLLSGLKRGNYPVHILLLTRQNTRGHVFDRLKASFSGEGFSSLEMSTPRSSLQIYIFDGLRFTNWPGDKKLMSHITNSLLEKCQGNFLWLRMVIKELVNCDYSHEALSAIEETPPELTAMYQRIQAQLVKEMRPSSRELAVRILAWITCSNRQLTVNELAEGLETRDHPSKMLDPQQTISRLCGDLVVIDQNLTVSMTHHTAQEFVTQTPDSPLHVDTFQAHSMILRRCLDELTDVKFRLAIQTEGCREFLQYVVSAWSYHLALSTEGDELMVGNVASFLRSNAALCWINAVCQLGQLSIMTAAGKHLDAFQENERSFESEQGARTLHEANLDVMEKWSTDLVRIVGKFGQRLNRHPRAIHTLIAPFCPPESSLRRYPLLLENMNINVSGLRRQGWDDFLASFSVAEEGQPSAVLVLEDHFAIHNSDSKVALYTSSVFQQIHQLDHAEVIVVVASSQEGDKIVTCGFKTIKVWDVGTGELLEDFPNPANIRAVAAALTFDSRVLLCCTDGTIRSRQMASSLDWQVLPRVIAADGSMGEQGTPAAVAFSPDATKVSLVFKGRLLGLWSVQTGELIGRCQGRTNGPHLPMGSDRRSYPQRLAWNPVHEHVVGLYNDGTLFKWNPVNSFSEELQNPVASNEVACSSDGRFVLTAATRDGSLLLWDYESLKLVHHIACASPVTAVAISPDTRRLYDLREAFCNVWEPALLTHLADCDERPSEASVQSEQISQIGLSAEVQTAISDPVTSLAVARSGSAYCFATDNGDLTLRLSTGDEGVTVESGLFGATHLAFGNGCTKVACVEIDGLITIRSTDAERTLEENIRFNPGGIVQQLLFDKSDSGLIVKTPAKLSLWDPQTGHCISSQSLGSEDYWLELHPENDNIVIVFSLTAMRTFSLDELSLVYSWDVDLQKSQSNTMKVAPIASRRPFSKYHMGHSDVKSLIGKGFSTPDQRYIFLQIVQAEPQMACSDIDFFLVDLTTTPTPNDPISVKTLPPAVLVCIEIPLGFVEDMTVRNERHALAFLDSHFWVCSWSLGDANGDRIRRHFFLPNDWINLDCLDMAVVTADGRFVCPRNGEVAVISNGFHSVWVE